MIYEIKDCFVISSGGSWIPGFYKCRKAARYAYQFPNEQLSELQKSKGKEAITLQDLKKLRKEKQ